MMDNDDASQSPPSSSSSATSSNASSDPPVTTTPSPPAASDVSALSRPGIAVPGRSHSTFAATTAPPTAGMSSSSTPLGNLNAARRLPQSSVARAGVNPDIAARMKAFHLERRNAPVPRTPSAEKSQPSLEQPAAASSSSPPTSAVTPLGAPGPVGGIPSNVQLPAGLSRPTPPSLNSAPNVSAPRGVAGRGLSLAEKRGLKLPGGLPGAAPTASSASSAAAGARKKPQMSLANIHGTPASGAKSSSDPSSSSTTQSAIDRYSEYIDKETGSLKFKGKAVLTNKGVEFASGQSFSISLDEVDTLDELGKGNYGTVYKVRHARPTMRRPGQGLAGNKNPHARAASNSVGSSDSPLEEDNRPTVGSGRVMAMKELRLELEDSKFAAIIMELDILHKCVSPYIIDFYGAFFQEGAVYICMEFMDGSVEKLYGDGIPEAVLRKITLATTRGLRVLKDEHNIIHRDVKPTNILVNSMGAVKICDFGVSGNLVASIAKTNIGCQSYMAPERISSGGVASAGAVASGTYSVQSDIWSLGLTIIECALGRYPYPPETYDNIFSQLSAIVDGSPPDLPSDKFSEEARDFVAGCLNKVPKLRPTYAMLLQHVWLAPLSKVQTISEEDEEAAEAAAAAGEPLPSEAMAQAGSSEEVDEQGERWVDRDVGLWVREQLRKKREGMLNKHRSPALHAAPLDASKPKPKNAGAVAV